MLQPVGGGRAGSRVERDAVGEIGEQEPHAGLAGGVDPGGGALLAAGRSAASTKSLTVPIVISSSGLAGSFFTSEMALTNRGTTTATLTLANVQPEDSGEYRVIVDNALGSVTSKVARLTVLLRPRLEALPEDLPAARIKQALAEADAQWRQLNATARRAAGRPGP